MFWYMVIWHGATCSWTSCSWMEQLPYPFLHYNAVWQTMPVFLDMVGWALEWHDISFYCYIALYSTLHCITLYNMVFHHIAMHEIICQAGCDVSFSYTEDISYLFTELASHIWIPLTRLTPDVESFIPSTMSHYQIYNAGLTGRMLAQHKWCEKTWNTAHMNTGLHTNIGVGREETLI